MYNDDLFNDEALEQKNSFLKDKETTSGKDGLYRVDLNKVKPENKKRGYKAVIRFLPNITQNPEYVKAYLGDKWDEDSTSALGPSAIRKVSHFLNITEMEELKGWYDCPTNINLLTGQPFTTDKYGPIAKTYFTLKESKDALAQARSKMISYSNKYFSYVLIIEDEQQPELEGKVMIFSYGNQIKEKIDSESRGELTGEKCNIFNLKTGKDFILLVKEKEIDKDVIIPTYINSTFKSESTSISLPSNGTMKNLPLDEYGNIPAKYKEKVFEFLLKRDAELESFAGKEWDEDTRNKAYQAIDYLTGKFSKMANQNNGTQPNVDDFSFDELNKTGGSPNTNTPPDNNVQQEQAKGNTNQGDNKDEFDFDFDL